jgi:hypothetical protein
MPCLRQLAPSRLFVVVLAVLVLVYHGTSPALEGHRGPGDPEKDHHPAEPVKPLPAPVEEMRQAILAAAHTGRIEDLKVPLDWNEMKPDTAAASGEDPIASWKKRSVLANILEMKPAEVPLGKDIENNIVYVWPYLAEAKLDQLTPAEQVDLLRLVTPEKAKAMRVAKKWTWWRLSIGADGTWHSFKKAD